jgi:CRISPR-associated protein Csm4
MPFIGDRFYVPRPLAEITTDKEGNSSVKKALKKLSYLPADGLSSYIKGTMDIEKEADILSSCLGQSFLLEKAAVDTEEETRPYSVGLYRYYDGSGLYICLACESDKDYNLFTEMLEILSYAGIGGKTSAGYGRFRALPVKPGKEMEKRLELKSFGQAMSLSVCLPLPLEMEKAMENAGLRLVKRSGWVSSVPDAEAIRKRRDIYMFAAGSVFRNRFEGSSYDLGSNDAHPVLRYGYPMFMGVE